MIHSTFLTEIQRKFAHFVSRPAPARLTASGLVTTLAGGTLIPYRKHFGLHARSRRGFVRLFAKGDPRRQRGEEKNRFRHVHG